jgi:hypothetical protein
MNHLTRPESPSITKSVSPQNIAKDRKTSSLLVSRQGVQAATSIWGILLNISFGISLSSILDILASDVLVVLHKFALDIGRPTQVSHQRTCAVEHFDEHCIP